MGGQPHSGRGRPKAENRVCMAASEVSLPRARAEGVGRQPEDARGRVETTGL
jgi:hypothetical protein